MVLCEDQKAIDYYWDALSAEPEAEQLRNVTQAFLEMKKIDLEALKQAYES